MILTFDRTQVEALLQHSVNSTSWRPTFEGKKSEKPGLWLVGDQGVYLMSNGNPGSLKPDGSGSHVVCYADQVDPVKLEFDTWWANKRASFGGDDGCDLLEADVIRRAITAAGTSDRIALNVTPQFIEVAAPPKKR
jgi:hypothetical protein